MTNTERRRTVATSAGIPGTSCWPPGFRASVSYPKGAVYNHYSTRSIGYSTDVEEASIHHTVTTRQNRTFSPRGTQHQLFRLRVSVIDPPNALGIGGTVSNRLFSIQTVVGARCCHHRRKRDAISHIHMNLPSASPSRPRQTIRYPGA